MNSFYGKSHTEILATSTRTKGRRISSLMTNSLESTPFLFLFPSLAALMCRKRQLFSPIVALFLLSLLLQRHQRHRHHLLLRGHQTTRRGSQGDSPGSLGPPLL